MSEDKMFIAVVKCGDCAAELKRSNPVPEGKKLMLTLSAPLQNFRCENKECRSTYSDCNANVDIDWIAA